MTTITNKFSVSDAIQAYLNHGFGSMTKNDFEVWIFNYLLQNRPTNTSNFDFSVELRIPESKVKRLRYEASLKYGNPANTTQYNEAFQKLLTNVNLKKGSKDVNCGSISTPFSRKKGASQILHSTQKWFPSR